METNTIQNEVTESWVKSAISKGAVLAVIHIIVFVLLYFLAPGKLTGFTYLFFIILLNLGYAIYQGIQFRNAGDGFISFGLAFKYAFVLLLANGLIQSIFMIVFILVEPDYPRLMAQSQFDTSLYWAQKFGAPEAAIEQMQSEYNEEEMAKRYSLSGFPLGLGIGIICYCIGGLIVALFVKKNKPETF
jgi:hypothetical protein